MASQQATIDFLLEQMQDAGAIRSRKMFGEYVIYCNEKVAALVCDNQLFVKPTDAGEKLLPNGEKSPPYPGATPYFLISEDLWDDKQFLTQLISTTADALPLPKPKKKK